MIFEKHLPFPRLLKKSNSFPLLFFSSLQFSKSAVPSVNIVIVLIASRLSLPFRNNARYTVHKYVLQHILSGVQTRFLLAKSEGFEPPDARTSTVFKFYPAFVAFRLLLLFNSPNCRKISGLTARLSDNSGFLLCFGIVSRSLSLLIFCAFLTVFCRCKR